MFLLAEGETTAPNIISMLIGAAGGTGFAIWTAWYMITRVIPAKEIAFSTERAAAEKACQERFDAAEKRHADHFERERLDNREDAHERWKIVRENNDKVVVAIEKLTEEMRASNGPR